MLPLASLPELNNRSCLRKFLSWVMPIGKGDWRHFLSLKVGAVKESDAARNKIARGPLRLSFLERSKAFNQIEACLAGFGG